ncbi:ABC transporter ATP-binding protein [Streptomyces inhibens]|uniref:ABC transporter ATP-binding protein n=1 Tax=Streptomyces inhibens TaxID=2293571 RepID=A0A371PT08_STRIH|nr:ABC transporter ATP-binding protein [Streptomyces inhibens]REK85283.1 ABC transporter ATP-binding protein [Streptomyces inhibens]
MHSRLSTAGAKPGAEPGPGGEDRPASESEQLLFGGRLRDDHAWSRHDGAFVELGLWAMVVRLPHLLALTARLAHRADARALRMVVGAETGRGVMQAVAMVNINGVLAALLGTGATTERLRSAVPALLTVGLVAIVGTVLKSVSTMGTGRLEPKVERVATELYLEAAQKVEMAAVEDAEFHKRLESARFGASAARRMVQYSASVITALLSLIAALGVLTALHPALLPLIVVMTLPSAWAALSVARRHYHSHTAWMQHARAGRLLSDLLTSAQAAAEIRVHGIGGFLLRHFRLMAEDSELEQTRLARLAARTGLIAALWTGAATLATFGTLGWLLWSGAMALSVGGTAVIAIRTGSGALDSLVRQINYLHEEALFVGDLEHVQTEAVARAIPVEGRALPERLDEIRFENVTFTYPGAHSPALRELDLAVPAGKIVALVGSNGSGKTTAVKLLSGLYLPDEGRVLVGGVPTAVVDRNALFSRVSTVGQDYFRWPFTARANIAIGRADAPLTDARLDGAVRYADAQGVIREMPRGLDTLLARGYKDGHNLSGGQWQKLAIARARYRDGEILVVDEPTAALDAEAEQEVFSKIRHLAADGQTIVLITHRLHSVRHADLICLMEHGRIVERGTFQELMAPTAPGGFRAMYELQRSQFQPEPDRPPLPAQNGRGEAGGAR